MKRLAIYIALAIPIFWAVFWLGGEAADFKGSEQLLLVMLGAEVGLLVWLRDTLQSWMIDWGYKLKEKRNKDRNGDA